MMQFHVRNLYTSIGPKTVTVQGLGTSVQTERPSDCDKGGCFRDGCALPIHDRHEVQKASPHRNVGKNCAPPARQHMFACVRGGLGLAVDHHVPEQIRSDLVLWMLLAGIGLLVNWNQPHETHQTADTMSTALVVVTLHIPCHLARAVPWRFQELLVDDCHEPQVLCTLALWLVIQIRSGQR